RAPVISGAGVSQAAGLPCFRTPKGLFSSLQTKVTSFISGGKDVFDISILATAEGRTLHTQTMASLAFQSRDAEPTLFHRLLRELDHRSQLLRNYTQNIDAIEEKSGLTFGLPVPECLVSQIPRCIPMHGSLENVRCSTCARSFNAGPYLDQLVGGKCVPCPGCTEEQRIREASGKRVRGECVSFLFFFISSTLFRHWYITT
ncbi:DHS-like NAD/FAD-binding domain-containing protein, partial [Flagelloscypha sp. PMI_526]